MLGLVATNELPRLAELLAEEVHRLARGGAEVALYATNELISGNVVAETKAEFLRIIARMRERSAIEAIILGGTELSLILREDDYDGVTVLATTRIHVVAAIREMLA